MTATVTAHFGLLALTVLWHVTAAQTPTPVVQGRSAIVPTPR